MKRPLERWTDSELPENLARALHSAAPAPDDDDALARMRSRLSHALGPSFESRAPQTSPAISTLTVMQGRAKWLAAGALVAASLSVLGLRPMRVEPAQTPSVKEGPNASGAPQSASAQGLANALWAPQTARFGATPDLTIGENANRPCAVEVPGLPRKAVDGASVVLPKGRRSQRQSVPVSAREQAVQSGLAEELRGIERIRALMAASPARALAEARAQQRRFSHGALAPERELLRVEALLRMGRVSEATARAHAHGTPSEPYRQQLERLLAAHTP